MTISEKTKVELADFESDRLDCNPSFAQSQKEIIELIDLYWLSKFKESDKDSLGMRKCFYNVIVNPTEVSSKMIDFDTKDILLTAAKGQSYYPVWFFKKDLDIWMKKNLIGMLLNEIVYKLPRYGHILLKKAGEEVFLVPLQTVRNKQDAENFLASPFLIEEHTYTPEKLRGMNWNEKVVEKAIERFGKDGEIFVYERHGEWKKGLNYHIMAGTEDNPEDFILHSDNIAREDLYRELKWEEVPGRALGRGQPEKFFEAQIHQNQIANYKRQGLYWTSKKIWQTRDESIAKNLMVDVDNGEILRGGKIEPVDNAERNLGAYIEEERRWDMLVDRLGFSYDVIRGERTPAGTPLGSAILQTRMAGGFFDLKREDMGLFFKEVLFDWILPDFKKQKRAKHTLPFSGTEDEVEKFNKLLLETHLKNEIAAFASKNGHPPQMTQVEIMKAAIWQKIKKGKGFLEIPEKYYDNVRYIMDIIITGEQVDVAAKLTTLQTVFQIIGTNPLVLRDKRARKFFYKMCDLAGISPTEFGEAEAEEPTMERMAERGSPIAKVPPTPAPAAVPAEAKV